MSDQTPPPYPGENPQSDPSVPPGQPADGGQASSPYGGQTYQPPPAYGSQMPPTPPPPPGYQTPGQPAHGYGYPQPPKHPQATTAMVLGIIAVAGSFFLCFPLLLSPVAWIIGGRVVKEIDANPGVYSGRSEASAGRVLGIVGSVLLVLAIVALIVVSVVLITTAQHSDSGFSDSSTRICLR